MKLLVEQFENHWFPDQPYQGQGYRCIRFNRQAPRDPMLQRVATECGLRYDDLKLPLELKIWTDPNDISYSNCKCF
jgi:protein Tob/BTG